MLYAAVCDVYQIRRLCSLIFFRSIVSLLDSSFHIYRENSDDLHPYAICMPVYACVCASKGI